MGQIGGSLYLDWSDGFKTCHWNISPFAVLGAAFGTLPGVGLGKLYNVGVGGIATATDLAFVEGVAVGAGEYLGGTIPH